MTRSHQNHLQNCYTEFIPQLCTQPDDGLQELKHVADDKLLIKLCLDLFYIVLYSFMNYATLFNV